MKNFFQIPNINFFLFLNYLIHFDKVIMNQYIFFLTDDINNQEVVSNSIYNLNSGDYFSVFYLAYVKFKQNKIPECSQIIKSGIENCDDEDFKKYFIHF